VDLAPLTRSKEFRDEPLLKPLPMPLPELNPEPLLIPLEPTPPKEDLDEPPLR